ncbi:MAG TPA: tRNA-modifying protein YgfZ [Buchnera sp. (in: enterobacteria)]|nr:tRNA-modifying protein YgfZ [Buchnera sp. (in: enterobacteria)]
MKKIKFEKYVYPANKLSLSFIELDDWSFITVGGADSRTYLQSQLTINIDLLKSNKHIICAHCNVNGKVWSILRLFHFNHGYAYIERKDVALIQIRELKKYAIFSKVTICQENNFLLFGIAGFKSREILTKLFSYLPDKDNPVVTDKNIILLWIGSPQERFLLITPQDHPVINKIKRENIFLSTSNQWLSLEIESGFPIVSSNIMNKFIPLSLNLEKLGGIDFKKGCYYGQEVVAKMKFRSMNKYSLYWLVGVSSCKIPNIGSLIEFKKIEHWYAVGYVLMSVIMYDGSIWMQAILDNTVTVKNIFRISGEKNSFYFINN